MTRQNENKRTKQQMLITHHLILSILITKLIISTLTADFKVEISIIFHKYILNGENIFYNSNAKYI